MNNINNYDDENALIDIVNRKKQFNDEDIQMQKNISWDVQTYSKQIAQAKHRIKTDQARKKQIERSQKIKRIIATALCLSVLAVGIGALTVHGDDIINYIQNTDDLDSALGTMTRNTSLILEARGLTIGGLIQNNSIKDYKGLNVTSTIDVYVYKYASNMSLSTEEFNKFIQSVSYYDEEGNICFYASFEEFLKINKFNNEEEFKKATEKLIIDEYKKGNIQAIIYEGPGTANRGGRKNG